jgi:hypothetical protein
MLPGLWLERPGQGSGGPPSAAVGKAFGNELSFPPYSPGQPEPPGHRLRRTIVPGSSLFVQWSVFSLSSLHQPS